MSVKVRTVRGGSNTYNTPAEDFNWLINKLNDVGVLLTNAASDFHVEAQGTPDMTVKVNPGNMLLRATPTSESQRIFGVELTAATNVTIQSNSTGSTKYDKIIVVLDADDLHDPPADGDFTEATSIVTERHNAAGEAVTTANAFELAEVAVADGATSIANSVIGDSRVFYSPSADWTKFSPTVTRTGNHTFTVKGNLTALFPIGMRFRYRDGSGDEYGTVKASSHSANVTTVILVTNTDYVMADASITDTYISSSLQPKGFPRQFAFTPTTPQFIIGTGGSAEAVGEFSVGSGRFRGSIKLTLGTSGQSVGTNPGLTLPIDANSSLPVKSIIGHGVVHDLNVGNIPVLMWLDSSTFGLFLSTPTSVSLAGFSSSSPVTTSWASGDNVTIHFDYPI